MAFRYGYQEDKKDSAKKAVIAAVVLILILSIYSLGTTITGYLSYSNSVESELNKTQAELTIYKFVSEECTRNLWLQEKNLSACEIALGLTNASMQACNQRNDLLINWSEYLNASLSSCMSELDIVRGAYGNITFKYSTLVRNSAREICCTFGDVQSQAARNWDIKNDQIVCSGSLLVNCSSGETTF